MTRNKVTSIFLAVVLVMAIAVAPVVAVHASQSGLLAHVAQGGFNSLSIQIVSPAVPGILTCEGCSLGGGGPV